MKSIASLVTAVMAATLLSLGLAGTAQATHGYGPHIDTGTSAWSAKNPIRARQAAAFRVRVTADNGRHPDSRIRYRVIRRSNGNVVDSGRRFYNGGRETYSTDPLGRGRYRIIVVARPVNDRYNNSAAVFGQRVKRR